MRTCANMAGHALAEDRSSDLFAIAELPQPVGWVAVALNWWQWSQVREQLFSVFRSPLKHVCALCAEATYAPRAACRYQ